MATTALRPAATYRSGVYDWLTTTDHKKIGILYFFNSLLLFLIGGLLALAVRSELAQPGLQFMSESTYNQVFTMHASVMIFWVVIPFLAGFGNYFVPLMIGAPDMAFPRINALSFWLLPCRPSSPSSASRSAAPRRRAGRATARWPRTSSRRASAPTSGSSPCSSSAPARSSGR